MNIISKEKREFPQKAAVIIDGGYWRKNFGKLEISNVDLVSFSDICSNPAYRIRTTFFDGKKKNRENQSFHDSLMYLDRFDVFLGDVMSRPTYCTNCNKILNIDVQKRVDVALAVELVHLASTKQIDVICLIAGDQDFLPAIESAKSFGIIIRLFYFKDTISDNLLKAVDERKEINRNYLDHYLIDYDFLGKEEAIEEIEQIEVTPKNVASEIKDFCTLTDLPEIPLSTIGTQVSKIFPDWKNKLAINGVEINLKYLITEHMKDFEIVEHNDQNYLKLKMYNVVSFKDFVIQTISESKFAIEEKIGLNIVGKILMDEKADYRSYYKIKKLYKSLDEIEEFSVLQINNIRYLTFNL